MSTETELKLSLPRTALAALRRHPVLLASPKLGNARTLENTYYDTPGRLLRERGIALRTRRHARRRLQTVKCASISTGGLSQRPEWEQPCSGAFDFSAIDLPAIRKWLTRHRDDLTPVFSTRFRRETRIYTPDADTRILIMVDTGEVLCGERSEPICEIELELNAGKPLDLLHLACELARDLPLLPHDVSKAERGYRLLAELPDGAARAEPSDIQMQQTPVEAFRQLAFSCVRQWQANVRGAATGQDPEFIHQLRVSQRRLRSLIRLFAPSLPAEFAAGWSECLRGNADSLGAARDLDVLCDEILAPVEGTTAAEIEALARLKETLHNARPDKREAALDALGPAEQGRLLLAFSTALHELPTNNLIGSADLHTFAALQLDGIRARVHKRHKAAHSLAPSKLHSLRIALKGLRYGMEFFAPLMPEKSVSRYLKSLTRAQDALGFINDLNVARKQLARSAGDDPQLQIAAAFVCGWHGPRYSKLCRRAIDELGPLLKGTAPWHE